MSEVRRLATLLVFDVHSVPGKYFVLCDWYMDIIAMFDDNQSGYQKAIAWMQSEKIELPEEKGV